MKPTLPDPGSQESKKEQVARMFNHISRRYDFLNHLLSFQFDKYWRKYAIRELEKIKPELILDVATGTGDFAFAALKLNNVQIVGLDISEGMLQIARRKAIERKVANRVTFFLGDAEELTFSDNRFDAVTVAFGVRNFGDAGKGLAEIFRVLKPGGKVFILEFSKPSAAPFRQLYWLYFSLLLPWAGRMVSGNRRAYSYLFRSVAAFPDGSDFLALLGEAGFIEGSFSPLTGGVATLYVAGKPCVLNGTAQ